MEGVDVGLLRIFAVSCLHPAFCNRKSFEDRKQAALAAIGAVKSSVYKMQEQLANQEMRLAELGDRRRFMDEERSALAHELMQGVETFQADINKVRLYNRPHPAQ